MTAPVDPASPDPPANWLEALDRLEAHAERAERLLPGLAATDVAPWTPPSHLDPMPEDFILRARMLLERQQKLMAAIRSMLADNRQQHRVADRVSDATTGRSTRSTSTSPPERRDVGSRGSCESRR